MIPTPTCLLKWCSTALNAELTDILFRNPCCKVCAEESSCNDGDEVFECILELLGGDNWEKMASTYTITLTRFKRPLINQSSSVVSFRLGSFIKHIRFDAILHTSQTL